MAPRAAIILGLFDQVFACLGGWLGLGGKRAGRGGCRRQDETTKGARHLHLATFAATVERFRAEGVVDERSRVVAVHLAHDNPPLDDLAAELARCGAEVLADGTLITL